MPKRHRPRKHQPFVSLSLHQRRDAVVQLKWRIDRNALQTGIRDFWTDHLLQDPDDPARTFQWIDIYFIGRDRCTLWNAALITTALARQDAISARAFDATWAKLSAAEKAIESALEFKRIPRKHPSEPRYSEWVRRPDSHYAQFDGRTFRQECDRLEAHIAATSPPNIGESFTLDHAYAYGIGLHATVAEDHLDLAAIERSIARFRDIGERDWRCTV
ncbi:MAG: hypothetical protein KJ614_13645 [Gammaproteobacteria bacterium]|uniref:hypothetical protein n=1 Tax=Rhodoferax sp. TaxID=50421 RepID=UPI0017A2F1C1|nr:hypothetical protein [Rhodoferax sp.]MBU3899944.1 hypothetical protein [Gammaproteobacteria bacterium]MBA3057327.1 hypothetical protein [Rhodoferax sp.]MBU3995992.1 hypothetical protein [Gammaproteobacteria bacterium]MBU4019210.1 hypothetical protein [Gammaproteobacteria bacterium]MBU4078928.1 hypothetical protein [Gammaproteobacteria bacterium]